MKKRLINHHKYKRKMRRWWGNTRQFTTHDAEHSTKDFAWHRTKQNPFHAQEQDTDWMLRIKLSSITVSCIATALLLLYHPFFRIDSISVQGLERIQEGELKNAVHGIMNASRFFVPQNRYITADVQEIKSILLERYPIAELSIKKTFPDKLSLTVQEKISTVIYDNGYEYAYMGLEGHIVEKIRKVGPDEWRQVSQQEQTPPETIEAAAASGLSGTSTEQTEVVIPVSVHRPILSRLFTDIGGAYPVVYDVREKEQTEGHASLEVNQEKFDPAIVEGIIEWYSFLEKELQQPGMYFAIENNRGEAVVHNTTAGWKIFIVLNENRQAQFEAFRLTKSEIGEERLPQISYIDLRFPGRVYWK